MGSMSINVDSRSPRFLDVELPIRCPRRLAGPSYSNILKASSSATFWINQVGLEVVIEWKETESNKNSSWRQPSGNTHIRSSQTWSIGNDVEVFRFSLPKIFEHGVNAIFQLGQA